jgi:subtilase family serine protease
MRKLLIITLALTLLILASTSAMTIEAAPKAAPTVYNHITKPQHVEIPVTVTGKPGVAFSGAPLCISRSVGNVFCSTPQDLRFVYDFPILALGSDGFFDKGFNGTGSTIVIVDAFGSPTEPADLAAFDTQFALPAPPGGVRILCPPSFTGAVTDLCPFAPGGSASGPLFGLCGGPSWVGETTLDLAMAHGLAPGAKIVLVEANSCFDTDLNAAELAVVSQPGLKGSIMSQSFGEPDDAVDPGIRAQANVIYNIARTNLWTVLASSGDDGANEALSALGTTELTPSWPATEPLVLAVGGTQGSPYGGKFGMPQGCAHASSSPFGGTCTSVNPGNGTFNPPGPVPFDCTALAVCTTGLVNYFNPTIFDCFTGLRVGTCSMVPFSYGGEGGWNEYGVGNATNVATGGFFGIRTSSGGGISSFYKRPGYQASLPNSFTTLLGNTVSATNGRLDPDVSFNAAIEGGYLVNEGFACSGSSSPNCPAWGVFGGTSAGSPAWAAIMAIANQKNGGPIGFVNPSIYALAENPGPFYADSFHDIKHGNNSDTAGLFGIDGFKAGVGYDLVTGWGTPDVDQFTSIVTAGGLPFWSMTVNLHLLAYKIVNVQVKIDGGLHGMQTVTLSPGGPTATLNFLGLATGVHTVTISGYSIATQTQLVGVPPNPIVNFNIH